MPFGAKAKYCDPGGCIGWLVASNMPDTSWRLPHLVFHPCMYAPCIRFFFWILCASLRPTYLVAFSVFVFLFLFPFFWALCLNFVFMLSLELCVCSADIFLSNRPSKALVITYIFGYG